MASNDSTELSRREREVLEQIRQGLTNRQIAARFGISVNTINKHVQEVLRKLQVRNRVQAALHPETIAS
jgi:two-component system, NarL family, nitrate/nitrite response regulator NarL